MKFSLLFLIGALALTATGCKTVSQSDVVTETYIHKYGVPVAKEDWARNGKEGQVVLLRNDGVTETKTYEKGVLNGKSSFSFPNSSTIACIEMYVAGDLVSKIEHYFSGVAKMEERYSGGAVTERLAWYEDGTPASFEKYDQGLITTGEYRTPLNEIESKVADGRGIRITRGIDGELLFKDTIEGGQMIERIAYFPNGERSAVTSYKEGLVHGTRLTFLHGGLPNTIEEWVKGVQEGKTIVYLNGEKIAEVPYHNGKKEGVESRFRDGTFLVEEVTWRNDIQHGQRKIYLNNNEVKTEWYHQGDIVSRATYERMNLVR